MIRRATALLALAGILAAPAAAAHSRGTSYSSWTLDAAGVEVRARVSQLELSRLRLDPADAAYAALAGGAIQQSLQLSAAGEPCAAGPVTAHGGADGWVHARWRATCARWTDLGIRSRMLADVAPSHLHFVRVQMPDGQVRQKALRATDPVFALPAREAAGASFPGYVTLGVGHILSGWDHLAFVLALLLLAASLREVAVIATGFTVAHSLTLGAAVMGIVGTRGAVVEALIGFSIALMAVENLWQRGGRERWVAPALVAGLGALAAFTSQRLPPVVLVGLALFTACYLGLLRHSTRPARLRAVIGFVFGLVHGFGFAGALAGMELPAAQLGVALLGFNLGVEAGQLLVIALVWPALRLVAHWPQARAWTNDGIAAGVCVLGTYWFVVRSFA